MAKVCRREEGKEIRSEGDTERQREAGQIRRDRYKERSGVTDRRRKRKK